GSRKGWPASCQWRSHRSTLKPGTPSRASDARTKSGTVPRSSAMMSAPGSRKMPSICPPSASCDGSSAGEQMLGIFREPGADIIAEDLGTVPDFVRASLARLGVPGFKVLRWERHWHDAGQPFREPTEYPPVSVATSGTHDTEPLLVWWEESTRADREQVNRLATIQRITGGESIADAPYDRVRDVLLEALFASGSDLLLLPIQDVFGWRDRINVPATIGGSNWTYRLPWPVDRFDEIPEARERQQCLREWARQH